MANWLVKAFRRHTVTRMTISTQSLSNNIRALIADQLGIEVERVTDQSHLMNDLGLDWLKQLELVIFVEEFMGVELLDDGVDQIKLVGDLIRYLIGAEANRKQSVEPPNAVHD